MCYFQIINAALDCLKQIKVGTNYTEYRKMSCDPQLSTQVLNRISFKR